MGEVEGFEGGSGVKWGDLEILEAWETWRVLSGEMGVLDTLS